MPELPEVETVRRGLAPVLEGARVSAVRVARPDLRRPIPPDLGERMEGVRIDAMGRRAKYLLFHLHGGLSILWHLGMSGSFRILKPPYPDPGKHDHIDIRCDSGVMVRYNDPRRFGSVDMAETGSLDAHPLLAHLGPEPLSNAFNGSVLADRLKGRRLDLKNALLNQTIVAGLGNIYVNESLFRAGLSPTRSAAALDVKSIDRLARTIRDVLSEAVAAGGSSLRDHRQADGDLGYFQHRFTVYGKTGQACPGCDCDIAHTGGISHIIQGGRSTFYCPRRQR